MGRKNMLNAIYLKSKAGYSAFDFLRSAIQPFFKITYAISTDDHLQLGIGF